MASKVIKLDSRTTTLALSPHFRRRVTPLPGGVLQPFEHSVTRTAAVIKILVAATSRSVGDHTRKLFGLGDPIGDLLLRRQLAHQLLLLVNLSQFGVQVRRVALGQLGYGVDA
jgi:hypothetical protein